MHDSVDHLFNLSDPELLLWWSLFGTFPTQDRRQRDRLRAVVAAAVAEPALLGIHERTPVGEVELAEELRERKTA